MLKHIASILRQKAEELENGTSKLSSEGCYKVLNFLNLIENGDETFTKTEAADYIHVSKATFENYVRYGKLPQGVKLHQNSKLLFWYKSDLDKYLYG